MRRQGDSPGVADGGEATAKEEGWEERRPRKGGDRGARARARAGTAPPSATSGPGDDVVGAPVRGGRWGAAAEVVRRPEGRSFQALR